MVNQAETPVNAGQTHQMERSDSPFAHFFRSFKNFILTSDSLKKNGRSIVLLPEYLTVESL
jgi:hypothetical protein